MKKLLVAAVTAMTLVGSAFAVEFKVDADFAMPIEKITYKTSGSESGVSYEIKDGLQYVPVGLSLGADAYFTDLIGATFKVNLGFGNKINETAYAKIGSNSDSDTSTLTADSGVAYSFFLGAAIRPVNGKFFLSVAPGAVLAFTSLKEVESGVTTKITSSGFGIGADLQLGFKVTNNIAINGGVFGAFLFSPKVKYNVSGSGYSVSSEYGESLNTIFGYDFDWKSTGFIIEPKVGVSIIF